MDEIIGEFVVESMEGIDRLDQNLIVLETDPKNHGILDDIFRTLHSIKGACGFLDFATLEKVAHRGENLLSLLREDVLDVTPEITDALLATVDAIRAMLEVVGESGEEGSQDVSELLITLERIAAQGDPNAEPADPNAEAEMPQEDGDATNDAPADPDAAATEGDRVGDILTETGEADRVDVEIAAKEQELGDQRPIGEILVDEKKTTPAKVDEALTKQAETRSSAPVDSTIRVDVKLLDKLMNLVGELVLTRNQIVELADNHPEEHFTPTAHSLNLITSELQEGVMKTRMQPIGNLWAKLPRVVRDLSRQMDKKIEIEMDGADTELDKTIIEAIKDPLTHIVRNTVDHGIEPPADRLATGKPEAGVLRLKASHEGGLVTIEISDDGAGIDAARLKAKALKNGQISEEVAAKMSETEALYLIFMPGFSTAEKVSAVSGRGVGMDVVKTNIERIGGTVEVRTEMTVGTTFKIKIPLTLAIIPALTIRCAGSRFAIPQVNLLELVRTSAPRSEALEDFHGTPVFRLRGRLLPIVDLREQIGKPCRENERSVNIVVLQADDVHFGLVVDEILDTQEIVVKPLCAQVSSVPHYSGSTTMGDGRVALILDVMNLAGEAGLGLASKNYDVAGVSEGTEPEDLDDGTILLLDLGGEKRAALPLRTVARLEKFSAQDIETAKEQPVVQYRGSIMPLIDLAAMLGLGSHDMQYGERPLSVAVYNHEGNEVGLVVDAILDIVDNDGQIDTGSASVIRGKVTEVINPEAFGHIYNHRIEEIQAVDAGASW